MKKTKSDGFCLILGGRCYKECPHHYYREFNGCWKPELSGKCDDNKAETETNANNR